MTKSGYVCSLHNKSQGMKQTKVHTTFVIMRETERRYDRYTGLELVVGLSLLFLRPYYHSKGIISLRSAGDPRYRPDPHSHASAAVTQPAPSSNLSFSSASLLLLNCRPA
jgi:hypothetical protein